MAILGLNATTFFVDDVATPATWTKVGPITNETLNLDKALADITDRRANGWRLQVGTLKEATIDAELIYDPTDAQFIQFSDAFFGDSDVLMGFMDGDINNPSATSGSYDFYGLVGAFSVTTFTQNRDLEEALRISVTFTPVLESGTGEPPRWHKETVVVP